MTDPANPNGYAGDWLVYATRCGHPLFYVDTELQAQLMWHHFDHGMMNGPSVQTERHSAVRLATRSDVETLRRGDSCESCSLDTTPTHAPRPPAQTSP
jgi:hypothetical protein